jgi:hypothetical protein
LDISWIGAVWTIGDMTAVMMTIVGLLPGLDA